MKNRKLIVASIAAILLVCSVSLLYFYRQTEILDLSDPRINIVNPDIVEHPEMLEKEAENQKTHTIALGFSSLDKENQEVALPIKGTIPTWVNGMLLRSGPALFESKTGKANQWFDGCAMLHKFAIESGKVTYSNKFIKTDYYDQVRKTGQFGLKKEKSSSFFSRLGAMMSGNTPKYDNNNTHICCIGGQFCAMTETPHHTCFDPVTLESREGFSFADKLDAHYCCAHPLVDENTDDMYNYNIQFGNTSTYIVYKIPAGTKQRVPLAKINVGYPSYMHSFAMTEHYLILTEVPFRINPLDLLMTDKSFFEAFNWKPKQGTKFIVIDKESGKTVGTYTGDALFTLHHINAFEKDNKINIDIAAYDDPCVVHSFRLDNLRNHDEAKVPRAYPTRITIDLDKKPKDAVSTKKLSKESVEMPHINYENFSSKPYTYVYGTHATVGTGLIKIDVNSGRSTVWAQEGNFPGEPIFVANPNGKEEDDGVLLSTVLDTKKGNSFLLILDAKTMKEIARAELDHHIPFDSHGHFFPK